MYLFFNFKYLSYDVIDYMKTVLITGANRGIGLATAKLLKKRKYKVIGSLEKKLEIFQESFLNVT